MPTNAAYAVVVPSNHDLRIRYWLKNDVDGRDGTGIPALVEGTITKYVTINCEVGKIYDITANLAPKDYSSTKYYMWDAQLLYWAGHEWDKAGYTAGIDQPTANGQNGSSFPQSNSDLRYYNESFPGNGVRNDAVHSSFTILPNANEMSWYCVQGDPRWDADELWTTMGHLYKGGMWFKKLSQISLATGVSLSQMKEKSADGTTDLRTTYKNFDNTPSTIPLTSTGVSNFFYLPILGYHYIGTIYNIGYHGYYMSSSVNPNHMHGAYVLNFYSGRVYLNSDYRNLSFNAIPLK